MSVEQEEASTMDKKRSPVTKLGNIKSAKNSLNDTSTESQRQRLLVTLQGQAVSTLFARGKLNILSPAGRIYELRKRGYRILTHWIIEFDTEGRRHRVAKYVLLAKKGFSNHG
jgi:hypothetical protein